MGIDDIYYNKYLKYKSKYITLKGNQSMIGGNNVINNGTCARLEKEANNMTDLFKWGEAYFKGDSNCNPGPNRPKSGVGFEDLEDVETVKAASKFIKIHQNQMLTIDSQPYNDWKTVHPRYSEYIIGRYGEPGVKYKDHGHKSKRQEYVYLIMYTSEVANIMKNLPDKGIAVQVVDGYGNITKYGDSMSKHKTHKDKLIREDGTVFTIKQRTNIDKDGLIDLITNAEGYSDKLKNNILEYGALVLFASTTWGPKDKILDWLVEQEYN